MLHNNDTNSEAPDSNLEPNSEPLAPEPVLASNANGNANLASPNNDHHKWADNKTNTHKQISPNGHGLARHIHNKNEQVIAKSFCTAAINTKDQNTTTMTNAKIGSKTFKDALIRK